MRGGRYRMTCRLSDLTIRVKIERAQAGAYAVELLDKLMKNDFPEDTVFPLHAELSTRFIARKSL